MSEGLAVSERTFEDDVLKADRPVLVDFWAEWCGPCKALAPVIDDLAGSYKNEIKVCKVDVDDNPNLAAQHGVMGIPTVMLFHQGELVDRWTGVQRRSTYAEKIDQLLNG